MKTCFLIVAAVLVHIPIVTGCSCVHADNQRKYCQSHYVVIAKVVNSCNGNGVPGSHADRIYDVDIQYVYKGDVTTGKAKVRTAGASEMCGVSLRNNAVYLLNGGFDNGQMRISSCEMIASKPVNHPHTVFLFNPNYDCRCKVENILLEERDEKPKWVCARGNVIDCSSESDTMAECRYDREKDDCDWTC